MQTAATRFLAITGVTQTQMTCKKTFSKAYEIIYISSITIIAWFTSYVGRNYTFTETGLNKTESNQLYTPTLNNCNS